MTYEATVLGIARGIVAEDSVARGRSADEVTDIVQDLIPNDAAMIAHLLVAARVVETDGVAQEAQFHALADVAEWHDVPASALERICAMPHQTVSGSQVEYMAFLRSRMGESLRSPSEKREARTAARNGDRARRTAIANAMRDWWADEDADWSNWLDEASAAYPGPEAAVGVLHGAASRLVLALAEATGENPEAILKRFLR